MENVFQDDKRELKGRLADLKTEVYEFSSLAPMTYRQFLDALRNPSASPYDPVKVKALADILRIDKKLMSRMNNSSPVIPNDSGEGFVKLAMQPGTQIIALKASVKIGTKVEEDILGFGRIHTIKKLIPDLKEIPKELKATNIIRLDRLFINDEGREYFNGSLGLDSILAKVSEIAGDRLIVVKLLMGPDDIGDVWSKAQKALIDRGYDLCGVAEYETFQNKGSKIDALFQWASFPPKSGSAIDNLVKRNEFLESLEIWKQKRLSWMLPYVAPEGQHIVVISGEKDAHAIASMYPGNWVYSVKPRSNLPTQKLRNLRTIEAAELDRLADLSADVIFCSSALPDLSGKNRSEVPSATEKVHEIISRKLKIHGKYIERETSVVDAEKPVLINLRTNDASEKELSTYKKFETFIRIMGERNYLPDGFVLSPGIYQSDNRIQFQVPHWLAQEFLKKIRFFKDWSWEIDRAYCATSRKERERYLRENGLREVLSATEDNAWERQTAWKNHVSLSNLDGTSHPMPKGNSVIVVEKVAETEGVSIKLSNKQSLQNPHFLTGKRHKAELAGDQIVHEEEISRPFPTIDVIPVFKIDRGEGEVVYFSAKLGFPRPLAVVADPALDGTKVSPYTHEQISQIANVPAIKAPQELAKIVGEILEQRAHIYKNDLISIDNQPLSYFPFLGTSDIKGMPKAPHLHEQVTAVFAEVAPRLRQDFPEISYSGFSTSGLISAIETSQIFQACQVGSFRDARLERMAYEYVKRNRLELPSWIGNKIALPQRFESQIKTVSVSELLKITPLNYTETSEPLLNTNIIRSDFVEESAVGAELNKVTREYFTAGQSTNLISVLPVRLVKNTSNPRGFDIVVGIEIRHSKAIFDSTGGKRSHALTLPTMFVPKDVRNIETADQFARQEIASNYGLHSSSVARLGGAYFTSLGVTPTLVTPFVAFVDGLDESNNRLSWVRLEDLISHSEQILCAQALTALYRTSHAFTDEINDTAS